MPKARPKANEMVRDQNCSTLSTLTVKWSPKHKSPIKLQPDTHPYMRPNRYQGPERTFFRNVVPFDPFGHRGLNVTSLVNNDFLSDFKIKCPNEKVIPVHKIVLAMTSPVFKRMLQTDFKESTECEITITDFSYEIIMEMVVFMYTGDATNIDTKAIDLLKIADKYELSRLKMKCEDVLISTISVKCAVDLFRFADTYHAVHLEQTAIQFIKSHFKEVRGTGAYQTLTKHLLVRLCDAAMDYVPTK